MDIDLVAFVVVGFAAQLVDGALGMAFGVISTTLLIGLGVPPAAASAGVHTAETFTTGISGLSHSIARNVDWSLFARIVVPGVVGGVAGAYLLTQVPGSVARPFVFTYLTLIGVLLIWRGMRHAHVPRRPRVILPLGLAGGFLDAAGGGGWGPIVTSNLMMQGAAPRQVIGTVNLAEFFLTLTVSATFLVALGPAFFTRATLGLLVGGAIAAPFGAVLARRIPAKPLMVLVGIVLVATSAYGIIRR